MREVFYEESSKIQHVKSAKTKYNAFKVMSIISWILLAIWIYIVIFTFDFGAGNIIINILFAVLPAASFIASGIVLGRLKNKFYVDYDYTFVTGEVRISKVIKEIKRRPVMKFSTSAIEKLGKYGSETYETYSKMQGVKRIILTSNVSPDDEKDFYYLVVNLEEKKLLILECTETFIVNILKFANKSIVEKDYA